MSKARILKKTGLVAAAVVVSLGAIMWGWARLTSGDSGSASYPVQLDHLQSVNLLPDVKDNELLEPYYAEMVQKWAKEGTADASETIKIPGTELAGKAEEAVANTANYENESNVLYWNNNTDTWIEYRVHIDEPGLYQIDLSYHLDKANGGSRPANVGLQIDGEYPFREARAIRLNREWRDTLPLKKDEFGDHLRPRQQDISGWTVKPLRDSDGAYAAPLKWHFTQGEHTIRLNSPDSFYIESLTLTAPRFAKPYAEVIAGQPDDTPAKTIEMEAEFLSSKTASTVLLNGDSDPLTQPKAGKNELLNMVVSYDNADAATWTFEVPESGRYKLALRSKQETIINKASFRTLYIDGEVPFSEMYAYRFPYVKGWTASVISDKEGAPYEFWLEKGTHTLTLETTHAPVRPYVIVITKLLATLRGIDQDLKKLTADQGDANRTWFIERDMPELPERLRLVTEQLKQIRDELEVINGGDESVRGLDAVIRDLESLLQYPDEIPNKSASITVVMVQLSQLPGKLKYQPLYLDRLYWLPVQAEPPVMEADGWQKTQAAMSQFVGSFSKKGGLSAEENVLNVWMIRGRDHVNQLQEMVDEIFTPETGIKVKINLMPDPNVLLMASAAGNPPDVALGVDPNMPFELALRDSVLDLTQFDDFEQVSSRFAPGTMLPMYYNQGYYGIPETQSFNVLFYRKDILDRLGLKVPQTWEDIQAMLPVLQQNNMNFFVNGGDLVPYFYQNNAAFFTKDGTKTALDTPEGFKGFKQWTDLYNIYGLDLSVQSFYQHFRDGKMPVGIADFSAYLLMQSGAPELSGWWGIAPMPGTVQKDGKIARWSSGSSTLASTASIISKKAKMKDEAWTFLKWYMSSEVQERFSKDMETFFGPEFRWNTANVDAFARLSWKKEDLDAILKTWAWIKQIPNVPGGYLLTRELNNAWNRTVVDGMNYRTSLELAVKEINRELRRKQLEFNLIDENGNSIGSMDLPRIEQPWEGVNKYVSE